MESQKPAKREAPSSVSPAQDQKEHPDSKDSLAPQERKIVEAAEEPRIIEASEEELRKAVAYICALHSLEAPYDPDDPNDDGTFWFIILDFLRDSDFANFTTGDLRVAAKMNLDGTIKKVIPYRGINADFLGELLNSYKEKRGHALVKDQEVKKLQRENRSISLEERKQNAGVLIEDIKDDFERTLKGEEWVKPWSFKYDWLLKRGIMPEPTNDQKQRLIEKAKEDIEQEKRAKKMEDPFSFIAGGQSQVSRAKVIAVRDFYLRIADQEGHIRDHLPDPETSVNSDPDNQDPQS